eukprot:g2674.t1
MAPRSVSWCLGDGERLASESTDKEVRIWDANAGECLQVLKETEKLPLEFSGTLPGRDRFDLSDSASIAGIIHFLGTNGGTEAWHNPHRAKRMKVTRSSHYEGKASYAINEMGTLCYTKNDAGPAQWYRFDLMGHEAAPHKYALRHGGRDSDGSLRHWWFEASHDGQQWQTLRKHSDDESLNDGFASASWDLPEPQQKPELFRFFRVLQVGKNSSDNDSLYLGGFELWGAVRRMTKRQKAKSDERAKTAKAKAEVGNEEDVEADDSDQASEYEEDYDC